MAYDSPDYGAAAGYANSLVTQQPRARPTQSLYNPAVQNAADNLQNYKAAFQATHGSRYPDAQQFSAALLQDPTYQRLKQAHEDSQLSHVNGLLPGELGQINGAAAYANNRAQAVTTDAGSRATQAQGENSFNTGRGDLARAQANETTTLLPGKSAAAYLENQFAEKSMPGRVGQIQANVGKTQAETGGIDAATGHTKIQTQYYPQELQQRGDALKLAGQSGIADTELKRAQAGHLNALTVKEGFDEYGRPLQRPPAAAQPAPAVPMAAAPPPPVPTTPAAPPARPVPPAPPAGGFDTGEFGAAPAAMSTAASYLNSLASGSRAPAPQMSPMAAAGQFAAQAPASAPAQGQKRRLPDGRMVEVMPNGTTYLILPDGTRQIMNITQ